MMGRLWFLEKQSTGFVYLERRNHDGFDNIEGIARSGGQWLSRAGNDARLEFGEGRASNNILDLHIHPGIHARLSERRSCLVVSSQVQEGLVYLNILLAYIQHLSNHGQQPIFDGFVL